MPKTIDPEAAGARVFLRETKRLQKADPFGSVSPTGAGILKKELVF